jgi:zinc transport system substrate-binding protein
MRTILPILLTLIAALTLGCERSTPESAPAPSSSGAPAAGRVMSTFYPCQFFAERIAGGLVRVECPVPPDADPIFWQPDRDTVARFRDADLIVINGAEYEKWVASASLPLSRVCDTAQPFAGEFLKFQTTTHSHGASGPHSHEGTDGHTWMDPINATRQAEQIMFAMSRRWPQHERAFRDNYQTLAVDLGHLSERLKALSPAVSEVRLMATHPAYNYLAKRCGWTITNVNLAPDAAPVESDLQSVGSAIAASGSGRVVLLFESQPVAPVLDALRRWPSVRAVVFDPCETLVPEKRSAGEDYLSQMNANIDRLAASLKNSPDPSRAASP